MMVFKGVVQNGAVVLPASAARLDGMIVRVEAEAKKTLAGLLGSAGTWEGTDADEIVDEIYRLRSSAEARASLDE